MGTTANLALPYPEGTDQPYVNLDIKALADAVDSYINNALAVRPKVATGVEPFVFGGGNTLTKTIALPAGRFTAGSSPVVTMAVYTGYTKAFPQIAAAPTATSFDARVASVDASAISGTLYVHWIAMGT